MQTAYRPPNPSKIKLIRTWVYFVVAITTIRCLVLPDYILALAAIVAIRFAKNSSNQDPESHPLLPYTWLFITPYVGLVGHFLYTGLTPGLALTNTENLLDHVLIGFSLGGFAIHLCIPFSRNSDWFKPLIVSILCLASHIIALILWPYTLLPLLYNLQQLRSIF